MKQFINQATAKGWDGELAVNATSNPWTVTMQEPIDCVCKRVYKCLILRSLLTIEQCNVYYTHSQYMVIRGRPTVRVWYGITIKYKDCCGQTRQCTYMGSTLFSYLPEDFNPSSFTVQIPNPPCINTNCCYVRINFNVILCS